MRKGRDDRTQPSWREDATELILNGMFPTDGAPLTVCRPLAVERQGSGDAEHAPEPRATPDIHGHPWPAKWERGRQQVPATAARAASCSPAIPARSGEAATK